MAPLYDSQTALVVVDVQNDFADPAGGLFVPGGPDVVTVVNGDVAAAQEGGALVVYTQDWHPPDTPHFAKDGGTWPVHCVRDTWGAELHPGLVVAGEQVRKGIGGEDGYSGFTVADPETGETQPTGLRELLAAHGVQRVVVVGLALDVCVRATALDAVSLGYATTLRRAGTRPVELEPGDGERAVSEMAAAGVALA